MISDKIQPQHLARKALLYVRQSSPHQILLIDQETVYAPCHGNDRWLLGRKGSLNEYELDLLRQRSLSARYEKARRGELVVSPPEALRKAGDRHESAAA